MRSTIAIILLLPLLAAVYLFADPELPAAYDYREDPNITSWLSKKEAERLMRYHGASGLKVTSDQVFIRRNDQWVCVYHDPPYPMERSIALGSPGETVLANAERP